MVLHVLLLAKTTGCLRQKTYFFNSIIIGLTFIIFHRLQAMVSAKFDLGHPVLLRGHSSPKEGAWTVHLCIENRRVIEHHHRPDRIVFEAWPLSTPSTLQGVRVGQFRGHFLNEVIGKNVLFMKKVYSKFVRLSVRRRPAIIGGFGSLTFLNQFVKNQEKPRGYLNRWKRSNTFFSKWDFIGNYWFMASKRSRKTNF